MKKKTPKKLVLAKETLQMLDLASVRGGYSEMTNCAYGSGCGFICVREDNNSYYNC